MNYDLEWELRQALRRKEPSRDLMPRGNREPRGKEGRRWWTLPIAALLLLSVGTPVYRIHQQRKAKDQLVFALLLTARKLEHAKASIHLIETEGHR